MLVGIPREIKTQEYRVGLMPEGVHELVTAGHEVWIETEAGSGIGITDDDYRAVGACVRDTASEIFQQSDLIVKVKEPLPEECAQLRPSQLLFTYLHLAADQTLTKRLLDSQCTAVAYETVTDRHGSLPLLRPMSQVAGRLSVQVGSHCLEKAQGGLGVLLGGVAGVEPAHVVVIGGGVAGTEAIRMALGMQARVTVLEKSLTRLQQLQDLFRGRLTTLYSTKESVKESIQKAHMVIGAVLRPGASAPQVIKKSHLKDMIPGSVFVDISIDQGGCAETSRPTTHAEPTYVIDGVIHYCVANIPGIVPLTSTRALNNATLPFILSLAEHGLDALARDKHLRAGLSVHQGQLTCEAVALGANLPHISAEHALAMG